MTPISDELTVVPPEMLSMPANGSWGFLVTNTLHRSSPFAGMSRFVWFRDKESLEQALSTFVVAFDDHGPRSVPLNQYSPSLSDMAEEWKDASVPLEEQRLAINAELRNDSSLVWLGSFESLCLSAGPLEQSVRLWYRMEEGLAGNDEPLETKERGSFGYALQCFGL